ASRALLSLALHAADDGPTSVRDLAERTGLPQPYLEQILLALKGAGLVRSKRGVGGGYVLARPADEITLGQIVSAVDGPLVAEDADRRRVESQAAPLRRRQAHPAGRQHPQDVTMGEEDDVSGGVAEGGDDTVGPPAHVVRPLATWAPVAPEEPARSLGADVIGRATLVVAVVPLDQGVPRLAVAHAGQPARLRGAGQGTGQHAPEPPPRELGPRLLGLTPSPVGQWDIRA